MIKLVNEKGEKIYFELSEVVLIERDLSIRIVLTNGKEFSVEDKNEAFYDLLKQIIKD